MKSNNQTTKYTNITIADPASQLFWHLFSGSRGGNTRLSIINQLLKTPANTSQLAKTIKRDYKVVQHHLQILEKNNIVTKIGQSYGVTYFISPYLLHKQKEFELIIKKL